MANVNAKNAAKVKTSPKRKRSKNSQSGQPATSPRGKKEEKLSKRKQTSSETDDHSNPLPLLEARPGWDTIFFFFFLTHVLITVLWHSQMILPAKFYPQCLRGLTKTYSKDWQDPLNFSQKTPIWYLSIIYCEVFLQLPFHFVAIYVFWTGSHQHPWFR